MLKQSTPKKTTNVFVSKDIIESSVDLSFDNPKLLSASAKIPDNELKAMQDYVGSKFDKNNALQQITNKANEQLKEFSDIDKDVSDIISSKSKDITDSATKTLDKITKKTDDVATKIAVPMQKGIKKVKDAKDLITNRKDKALDAAVSIKATVNGKMQNVVGASEVTVKKMMASLDKICDILPDGADAIVNAAQNRIDTIKGLRTAVSLGMGDIVDAVMNSSCAKMVKDAGILDDLVGTAIKQGDIKTASKLISCIGKGRVPGAKEKIDNMITSTKRNKGGVIKPEREKDDTRYRTIFETPKLQQYNEGGWNETIDHPRRKLRNMKDYNIQVDTKNLRVVDPEDANSAVAAFKDAANEMDINLEEFCTIDLGLDKQDTNTKPMMVYDYEKLSPLKDSGNTGKSMMSCMLDTRMVDMISAIPDRV